MQQNIFASKSTHSCNQPDSINRLSRQSVHLLMFVIHVPHLQNIFVGITPACSTSRITFWSQCILRFLDTLQLLGDVKDLSFLSCSFLTGSCQEVTQCGSTCTTPAQLWALLSHGAFNLHAYGRQGTGSLAYRGASAPCKRVLWIGSVQIDAPRKH